MKCRPSWNRSPTCACTALARAVAFDRVVEMVASSQGSPFLLNFDERSIAGMMLELGNRVFPISSMADNVFDYAPLAA